MKDVFYTGLGGCLGVGLAVVIVFASYTYTTACWALLFVLANALSGWVLGSCMVSYAVAAKAGASLGVLRCAFKFLGAPKEMFKALAESAKD